LDDVLLLTLTGRGGQNTHWTEESTTFSGFAGQNLIIKAAGFSNSFGGYVDNTVLNKIGPVPEPATWLLMILGLGAVGGAMRQRQKATARIQFS
ncbi:MAG: PEPxxWA-CTERM sorting domain-containing protein, partial [Pseudomonadota bacterium]